MLWWGYLQKAHVGGAAQVQGSVLQAVSWHVEELADGRQDGGLSGLQVEDNLHAEDPSHCQDLPMFLALPAMPKGRFCTTLIDKKP